MSRVTEEQRKILNELFDVALTGSEIGAAAGIQVGRSLALRLTSLYRKGLIECTSMTPLRYRITQAGRDAVGASP